MKNLIIVFALCTSFSANADIYKCTTNGSVTYSNLPCEGEKVETYYKETEYDIQRREIEKKEKERINFLKKQQAEREQQALQVISLIEAKRVEDARAYAEKFGLDFEKVVAVYKQLLHEQEIDRQRRIANNREIQRRREQTSSNNELDSYLTLLPKSASQPSAPLSFSVPSTPQSLPSTPQSLYDPFSGTRMPRSGGGYIDPKTGTFYHDVGPGVVNTRTGQFTPTH